MLASVQVIIIHNLQNNSNNRLIVVIFYSRKPTNSWGYNYHDQVTTNGLVTNTIKKRLMTNSCQKSTKYSITPQLEH